MSANSVAAPVLKENVSQLVNRYILKPLTAWRSRRAAYEELMSLDDHMLADIGISRSEIPGIVTGTIRPRRAVNENRPQRAA